MESFLVDDFFGINQIYVGKFFNEKLHFAVKEGDIDEVDELLEEPGADINACYYGENLLWTAIMNNHEEMATFLIDNGVDTTFKCCRIDLQEDELATDTPDRKSDKKTIHVKLNLPSSAKSSSSENPQAQSESDSEMTALADVFVVTCRQLAYEKEMYNIVNLIDYKQGCLLKSLKPPNHKVRLTKSAHMTKEAAFKQIPLPPDRTTSPTKPPVSRKYRRRPKIMSSKSLAPPTILVGDEPTTTPRPGSNCDVESTIITPGDLSRRVIHTAGRRLPQPPGVHLTKAALARQRQTTMMSIKHDLDLRHPESADVRLARSPISPRIESKLEKRLGRCEQNGSLVCLKSTHSTQTMSSQSSYGNHLPFRRKPIMFDGYVERLLKRSVHSYQHSPESNAQRKFVGRF